MVPGREHTELSVTALFIWFDMSENYRIIRNYENLQKRIYEGAGPYNIPIIAKAHILPDNWIGFNYAKGCEDPDVHGVHFFLDDYQFMRIWTDADRYAEMLRKFQVVCAPDFSTYTDFPKAVQIWNHYRKHWCAAYWQEYGIIVIPTISWSDESSYEWCFDGEPTDSIVAVSSVGTQDDEESARLFDLGFAEMVKRLSPSKIVMYGDIPDKCYEYGIELAHIEAFHKKWRKCKRCKIPLHNGRCIICGSPYTPDGAAAGQ